MSFKSGDMCKFKGSVGQRKDLLQLGEYDKYNRCWYATSPVYGMMTIRIEDLEKLPKNFKIPES